MNDCVREAVPACGNIKVLRLDDSSPGACSVATIAASSVPVAAPTSREAGGAARGPETHSQAWASLVRYTGFTPGGVRAGGPHRVHVSRPLSMSMSRYI